MNYQLLNHPFLIKVFLFLVGNDHELFGNDPLSGNQRFGSYFNLAVISLLFGQSSTFCYDITCAIVLLTSYLGVASLFSRSHKIFVFIILCLIMSFWFILGRQGFFGKAIGFPSVFYILGLYLIQQKDGFLIEKNTFAFIVTLGLTFACAMVYPGQFLATYLITVGGLFLLFKSIEILMHPNLSNLTFLRDRFGLLLIMTFIAFSATGLLSLPRHLGYDIDLPVTWLNVFLTQLDVRPLVYDLIFSWYTPEISNYFLMGAVFILIATFFFTLMQHNIIAMSLIGSSLILLVVPFLVSNKWIAYQLSGALYPLSIFGCAWYLDDMAKGVVSIKNKVIIVLFLVLMLIGIAIRIPAFIESIHRYATPEVPSSMQYSKHEIERLAKMIDNKPITIDIPNILYALPILVEFGRRDMNLQWTEHSWKAILGYRNWQPPKIKPTHLVLGLTPDALSLLGLKFVLPDNCNLIMKTNQYQLFMCKNPNTIKFPLTYHT